MNRDYEKLVQQGRFVVACATIGERYAATVVECAHREGNVDVPAMQVLQLGVVGMLKQMQRHYTVDVDHLADLDAIVLTQTINEAMKHMTVGARFAPGYDAYWAAPRIVS